MSEYIRVDTPESVDLALEPAGLGSRFLASLIDGLIQWTAAFLVIMFAAAIAAVDPTEVLVSGVVGGIFLSILLVVLGFLFLGYKLLLEAFWNGQTLGKRAAGIRVVRDNGLPVEFLQALVRNLMRIVDMLPSYYIVGAITVLASKRNQRLGDMVAGTVVVRDRRTAAPIVPTQLYHQPDYDLNLLREHVLRLAESDLEAARGFWERRQTLEVTARYRVAVRIAEALAARMNWQEPLPPHPEMFIEAVLYVRAQ